MFPLSRPVARPYPPERGVVFEADLSSQTGCVPDLAGHSVGARVGAVMRSGAYLPVLDFDGVDDYVDFGNVEALNFGTDRDFTVEAVFNMKQWFGEWSGIFSKCGASSGFGWTIRHNNKGIPSFVATEDPAVANYAEVVPAPVDGRNKWVHFIGSFRRGTTISAMNNGIYASVDAPNTVNLSSANPVRIGKAYAASRPVLVAFFRVYNYAMGEEEMRGRYRGMQPYMAGLPTTVNLLTYTESEANRGTGGYRSSTVSLDSAIKRSGEYSTKVVTPGAVVGEGIWANLSPVPIQPGSKVTLSAYIRAADGTSGTVFMRISERDATASTGVADASSDPFTITDQWQRISFTATLHQSAYTLYTFIQTAGTTPQALTFWFDCLQVNYGDLLPWEPGF